MMKKENLAILWPCCPNLNLPPILQFDKSWGLHGAFLLAIRAAAPGWATSETLGRQLGISLPPTASLSSSWPAICLWLREHEFTT
jgi:hypothetical protein